LGVGGKRSQSVHACASGRTAKAAYLQQRATTPAKESAKHFRRRCAGACRFGPDPARHDADAKRGASSATDGEDGPPSTQIAGASAQVRCCRTRAEDVAAHDSTLSTVRGRDGCALVTAFRPGAGICASGNFDVQTRSMQGNSHLVPVLARLEIPDPAGQRAVEPMQRIGVTSRCTAGDRKRS